MTIVDPLSLSILLNFFYCCNLFFAKPAWRQLPRGCSFIRSKNEQLYFHHKSRQKVQILQPDTLPQALQAKFFFWLNYFQVVQVAQALQPVSAQA
jgi:hypothetical protein